MQRVGRGTLSVSLPSDWAKDVGLQKGQLVFWQRHRDELRLTARFTPPTPREVRIKAEHCQEPGILGRIVMGSYVLGHDTIRITAPQRVDNDHVDAIRRVTRRLMGIGIIEETQNQLVLQTSLDAAKLPLDMLLRRLYIIASTIQREAFQSLIDGNQSMAEAAILREEEAATIYWLILRLIRRTQAQGDTVGDDPLQILHHRLLAQILKRSVNWSVHVAMYAIELLKDRAALGQPLLEAIAELSELAAGLCHRAMSCVFQSQNLQLANRVMEDYKGLETRAETMQRELCKQAYLKDRHFRIQFFTATINPCTIAQLSFLIRGTQQLAALGAEIAELAINQHLFTSTELCELR